MRAVSTGSRGGATKAIAGAANSRASAAALASRQNARGFDDGESPSAETLAREDVQQVETRVLAAPAFQPALHLQNFDAVAEFHHFDELVVLEAQKFGEFSTSPRRPVPRWRHSTVRRQAKRPSSIRTFEN